MAVPRCSACGKALEDGFLHVNGTPYTTTWVGGPVEKSRWGFLKLGGRPRVRVERNRGQPHCSNQKVSGR